MTPMDYYYSKDWQIVQENSVSGSAGYLSSSGSGRASLSSGGSSSSRGSSSLLVTQYVWGMRGVDDVVLRDLSGSATQRLYALRDVMHVTSIVSAGGLVLERYNYDAYGNTRVNGTSSNVSFYGWEIRFCSYLFDQESGFYQVRNRYLHSGLGRWLSRDPLPDAELSQGNNLYWYVGNNPGTRLDPLGLSWIKLGTIDDCNRRVYKKAGSSDTLDELAKVLGLDASSSQKWAKPLSAEKTCYSVPNVWISANFLNGPSLREKFINIGAVIGQPLSDKEAIQRGMRIIHTTEPNDLVRIIKNNRPDIWGLVIYGHGDTDGSLGHYDPVTESYINQATVINALNGSYRIAKAIVNQCHGFYQGKDRWGVNHNFSADWHSVAVVARGYYGVNWGMLDTHTCRIGPQP